MQQNALLWLTEFKESQSGLEYCLKRLFMVNDPAQVTFVVLQCIQETVTMRWAVLAPEVRALVRAETARWATDFLPGLAAAGAAQPQPFVANKFAGLYAALVLADYPAEWPDAFGLLLRALDRGPAVVDIFCRVLQAIDDEVVAPTISAPRAPGEPQSRGQDVKDSMRLHCVRDLAAAWHHILSTYVLSEPMLARAALKNIAQFVDWIDISLIANDTFVRVFFGLMKGEWGSTPGLAMLREPACACLERIVTKGSDPVEKLILLKQLDLAGVLATIPQPTGDLDFDMGLAKLSASMCNMLLEVIAKLEKQGNREALAEAGMLLDGIMPHLLLSANHACDAISRETFYALSAYGSKLAKSSGNLTAAQGDHIGGVCSVALNKSCLTGKAGSTLVSRADSGGPGSVLGYAQDLASARGPAMAGSGAGGAGGAGGRAPFGSISSSPTNPTTTSPSSATTTTTTTTNSTTITSNISSSSSSSTSSSAAAAAKPSAPHLSPGMMISPPPSSVTALDDTEFAEFRGDLMNIFRSFSKAGPVYVKKFMLGAVTRLLARLRECSYAEVEAVLLLIYTLPEAIPEFALNDSDPDFSAIVTQLVMSDISACASEAVMSRYLGIVGRYSKIVCANPELLRVALVGFVGDRGIRNPVPAIRSKACYFFQKFVKANRIFILPLLDELLSSVVSALDISGTSTNISPVLAPSKDPSLLSAGAGAGAGVGAGGAMGLFSGGGGSAAAAAAAAAAGGGSGAGVGVSGGGASMLVSPGLGAGSGAVPSLTLEPTSYALSLGRGSLAGAGPGGARSLRRGGGSALPSFADQVILFESLGQLIGGDGLPVAGKQAGYIEAVLVPLCVRVDELVHQHQQHPGSVDHVDLLVAQFISALGYVTKGFSTVTCDIPEVAVCLKRGLGTCISALQAMPESPAVLSKAIFFMHRMVSCLGEEILPTLHDAIRLLSATRSLKEMAEVARLCNQLSAKFKSRMVPLWDALVIPIVTRIFAVLAEGYPSVPEELENEQEELKRVYFVLLHTLYAYDCASVLVSPTNGPFLPHILSTILEGATTGSSTVQKLSFNVMAKLIEGWVEGASAEEAAGGAKPAATPFRDYAFQAIIPCTFAVPLSPRFDPDDAANGLVLSEIAGVHRAMAAKVGPLYARFLAEDFFPKANIPQDTAREFIERLASSDVRFKNFLRPLFIAIRASLNLGGGKQ
jgi:hypothetical protein